MLRWIVSRYPFSLASFSIITPPKSHVVRPLADSQPLVSLLACARPPLVHIIRNDTSESAKPLQSRDIFFDKYLPFKKRPLPIFLCSPACACRYSTEISRPCVATGRSLSFRAHPTTRCFGSRTSALPPGLKCQFAVASVRHQYLLYVKV